MKFLAKFIFIGTLILLNISCWPKRCKGRQCTVRMMHYHHGDEYRGVNKFTYFFRNKNPRYGWGYPNLVKDPNSIDNTDKNVYDKKSKANLKVIKPEPKKEKKETDSNTEVAKETNTIKETNTNQESK